MRRRLAQIVSGCLGAAALLGCAGVKTGTPAGGGGGGTTGGGGAGGARADGAATGAGGTAPRPDGAVSNIERPPDLALDAEVFAHSDTTLYLLDPRAKTVRQIGVFDCVPPGSMVDIAIDQVGKMTGAAAVPAPGGGLGGTLVSIDSRTAHCTILTRTEAPITSLTYVPAGTLEPTVEVLVGYSEDMYLRINPTTGATTLIGMLNTAASGDTHWISSGDVVSITNGGTYLTVTGAGDARGDRIVAVDPKTGALTRIIGATGVSDILGLGYWAGVAYGFDLAGKLWQISLADGLTTPIAIPSAPDGLSFLGAGTTTSAPVVE